MTILTEGDVEDAARAWLAGFGWRVAYGPDLAPDTSGAERLLPKLVSGEVRWRGSFHSLMIDPERNN